jgi:hypothetical protein
MPSLQEQSEREFNAWLDSIDFVDKNGNASPAILTDDESDDVEGDREG